MPNYQLTLAIDRGSLPIIRASGQRITLARQVNGGEPNVVWTAFDPLEANQIAWNNDYGIYASTTPISDGSQITAMAETSMPSQSGAFYTFTAAGVFEGPQPGGISRGSYGVKNAMPLNAYPVLTFGLTQSLSINARPSMATPVSATAVLSTQQTIQTPFDNVVIWLQSAFRGGTVVTRIMGNSTVAKFGAGVTDIALRYDPNIGVFVQTN